MKYSASKITTCSVAIIVGLVLFASNGARGSSSATTWFSPANDAPDYIDLFKKPELWERARSQINVFKFAPHQVAEIRNSKTNTYDDLVSVDAFRKLKQWGIDIAIEVGSVKEYDCNAERTPAETLQWVANVRDAGSFVRFLAMDEPIASGLKSCGRTLDEIAKSTATYVRTVRSGDSNIDNRPPLEVGDIEAYPSTSVADIKRWISLLKAYGYKPAFFHLDVNIHYLDKNPRIDAAATISDLKQYFSEERIPFGIIIWSGYDPENSDQEYYNFALRWANKVHFWIGSLDQIVIQSWVTRSSLNCESIDGSCNPKQYKCGVNDPAFCGTKSVPINLPENNNNVFSHTRLLNNVLAIFAKH
jgi:hypothetical protein